MSASAVTRHFVDVGDRVVHYRMAGEGFPVLMLHQSPRSSTDMLALMARWSKDFLCIAPDTPGFGDSDPLKGPVSLERLARETLALAEALGLTRVGLYGVHTGAIVAVQAGVLAPERVAAVAGHGYGAWIPAERKIFGPRYVPPFRPKASGEHLAWLWNRCADQRLFFPWNDWRGGQRLAWGEGAPAELHAEALDFLRAGDAYRAGYLAAFQSDADLPTRLRVPALLAASRGDPLSAHLERLPALPPNVEAAVTETWDEAEEAFRRFLLRNAGPAQAPHPPPARAHRFVEVRTEAFTGRLHVAVRPGEGPATAVIHGPGGDGGTALDEAARLRGPLVAPDLPGHGLSDGWAIAAPSPAQVAEVVVQALNALAPHLTVTRLAPQGLAHGLIAALIAATGLPTNSKPPRALDRPDLLRRYLPDLTPDPDGAHLLRAWTAVRRQAAYDPWYEPTPANARPMGDLRPEALARRHLALLQAPGAKALLSACVDGAKCT